jgi:hypothetical protein
MDEGAIVKVAIPEEFFNNPEQGDRSLTINQYSDSVNSLLLF